jgi:hypothetical protein
MSVASLFKTTTSADAPFDGSGVRGAAAGDTKSVSDFLTVQALTNFAAMTGAITAAWHALIRLDATRFSGLWVPYAFAAIFGVVSILISTDALKNAGGKWSAGKVGGAIFVAIINALVLAGAVVGTGLATSPNGS